MQNDEQSPQYTGFLRSGAYPVISRKLVQYSDLLARAGGLAALAIIAGGAGYTLTQWLVPSRGAQIANAADSADTEPAAQRTRTNGLLDSDVLHANTVRDMAIAPTEPALDIAATQLSASNTPGYTRTSAHSTGLGRKQRHKSEALMPGATPSSDATESAPSQSADLDLLSATALRNELIAERVRALDDAREQSAPSATVAANAALSASPADLLAPTEASAPSAPSARPAPAPAAKAAPSVLARVPVLQLKAAANVEDLSVRGSLSASNVRRSVERLRPALAACYEHAAQHAGRNRFGRVELSLTIDETGRARTPRVQGAELPGLGACLSSVTGRLVSQAPDTGTVRASVVVNFAAP